MSHPIRFTPEAERELDEAIAWYENHSHGLGDRFAAVVQQSVSDIDRWPRRGSPVDGTDDDLDIRAWPPAHSRTRSST